MKFLSALAFAAAVALQHQHVTSFSPAMTSQQRGSPLAAAGVDVEALLARAAKLKAEAAAAEQALHTNLLEKKGGKASELDGYIDTLFPVNDGSLDGLVQRLKEKHWSTDRLMEITKRLHEREITAQGKGQVSASLKDDRTSFSKVSEGNPEELARVQGLIDQLLEAADIIDEDFMAAKREAKEQTHLNHLDMDHWTMGDLAGNLRRLVGELRREHDEQFQERLESFYEAQRKEKKHPKKEVPKSDEPDYTDRWP